MKYLFIATLLFTLPAMAESVTVYNSEKTPKAIEEYWTPERMKNAQPSPMGHTRPSTINPISTSKNHNEMIETIVNAFGKDNAMRLGFLTSNGYQTPFITPAGVGYLEYINTPNTQTLHDAYSAGFKAGNSQ